MQTVKNTDIIKTLDGVKAILIFLIKRQNIIATANLKNQLIEIKTCLDYLSRVYPNKLIRGTFDDLKSVVNGIEFDVGECLKDRNFERWNKDIKEKLTNLLEEISNPNIMEELTAKLS